MSENVTPLGEAIYPGTDFVLKLKLTNTTGVAITGARPLLTLRVDPPGPGNSVSKTNTELAEDGAGWYSYAFRVGSAGVHHFTWTYAGVPARVKEGHFVAEAIVTN